MGELNCPGRKHKIGRVERVEADGSKVVETMKLSEIEYCGHRTCGSCQWIDEAGDHVRHPIQVPTTWMCGGCGGTRHVLDVFVETPPQCAPLIISGRHGKSKTASRCRGPTLSAVYDQFGKLMSVPPTAFILLDPHEHKEAASFLLNIRGEYWLREAREVGSRTQPKSACHNMPREKDGSSSSRSEPPLAKARKLVKRVRRKLGWKMTRLPEPEPTGRENGNALEWRRNADNEFERKWRETESRLAAAAAAYA